MKTSRVRGKGGSGFVGYVKTFFEAGTSHVGRKATKERMREGDGDEWAEWERQLSM